MNSFGSILPSAEEPDDENMWVSPPFSPHDELCSGLHQLESTLRCFICKEFFSIPVTLLPCHHVFCGVCIRTHIRSKVNGMNRMADCPLCRVAVTSKGDENKYLIANHALERLVDQYKGLRASLSQRLTMTANSSDATYDDGSGGAATSDKQNGDCVPENIESEPKRGRTTRSGTLRDSSSTSEPGAPPPPPPPQQQAFVARPKKLPIPLYNSSKRKDLVAMCEKAGLSTKGSDRELKVRHAEYVKLYNAQCDSYHYKSPRDLAREVNAREQIRNDLAKKTRAHSASLEKLKENRKQLGSSSNSSSDIACGITAKSGDANFDAKFQQGFAKLITNSQHSKKNRKRIWEECDYAQAEQQAEDEHVARVQCETSSEATGSVATGAAASAAGASISTKDMDAQRQETSASPEVQRNPYSAPRQTADDTTLPPSNPYSARKSATSVATAVATNATTSARKTPRVGMTDFFSVNAVPKQPSFSQQSTTSSTSASQRSTSSRRSICGPWRCPRCTFHNEKIKGSRAKCEMCGEHRPAPRDEGDVVRPPPIDEDVVLLDV